MVVQIPEDDTGPHFKTRAMRDREDLNAEVAGVETGRQARFLLGNNSIRAVEDRKKKEEEQRFYSLLDMLLRDDPRYARLYHEVTGKLEKARQAVDLALIDIKQRQEAAVRELQKLRDNAGTLPDGTRVFRSSIDNGIYSEHGQRLSDIDAQRASIPSGAPSWEEYAAAQEERRRAQRDSDDTVRYRDQVLRPAQERVNNADDPPSMEELRQINGRIASEMPIAVASRHKGPVAGEPAQLPSSLSVAHSELNPTRLSVPDLRNAFQGARENIAAQPSPIDARPSRVAAPI